MPSPPWAWGDKITFLSYVLRSYKLHLDCKKMHTYYGTTLSAFINTYAGMFSFNAYSMYTHTSPWHSFKVLSYVLPSAMKRMLNARSCAAYAWLSCSAVVHSFTTSSSKHPECAYLCALWRLCLPMSAIQCFYVLLPSSTEEWQCMLCG